MNSKRISRPCCTCFKVPKLLRQPRARIERNVT